MEVVVLGATGLVGFAFVKKAIESEQVAKVWAFSRKSLPSSIQSGKLESVVNQDSSAWDAKFPQNADIVVSGVATTRADAGTLEKQRLVDHDLQVSLAKAARKSGAGSFVLVSSTGASPESRFGYLKMKGDTEQAVVELGFERTLVLRPGPLLGERLKKHTGIGAKIIALLMPPIHRSFLQALARYPVYADEIAEYTLKVVPGLNPGVHIAESADVLQASVTV